MTNKYPNLAEMGVRNPDQIASYTLVHIALDKDVLRIKYKRAAGSFLPQTRGYEFDRIPKASDPSHTTGGRLTSYEISPVLDGALRELDSIVHGPDGRDVVASDILDQLTHLEHEFAGELASLRAKLNQLKSLD
jgi:hypothetical protein